MEIVEWDVTLPFDAAELSSEARADLPSCRLVHAAAETASRGFVERPVETISTIIDGAQALMAKASVNISRYFNFIKSSNG